MKTLFWFIGPLLMLVTPLARGAGTPDEKLEEARKLSEAGNHREAADLAKTLLAPALKMKDGTRAAALSYSVLALRTLRADDEAEAVIEKTVADFPANWQMLTRAASVLQDLPHYGAVIDGKFQRGQQRNRGEQKTCQLRDRVRMLQLLDTAWTSVTKDAKATADDKAGVIDWLVLALGNGHGSYAAAWRLQILTDLTKLPDYDEQEGGDEPTSGYPVDEKGEPVFYKAAASWETAASDGERLFWLLDEKAKLGGQYPSAARLRKADLLAGWFSVRSLAAQGWRGHATADDAKSQAGIAALHTLKDDETVAKLTSEEAFCFA